MAVWNAWLDENAAEHTDLLRAEMQLGCSEAIESISAVRRFLLTHPAIPRRARKSLLHRQKR
jgi:hypothetical protein